MLLLLICTVGPPAGYLVAHYATLGFFAVRAAAENNNLRLRKVHAQHDY